MGGLRAARPQRTAADPSVRETEHLRRQRERFRAVNRSQVLTAFAVTAAALITNSLYFVTTRGEPSRAHLWVLQLLAVIIGAVATRPPRWIGASRTRRSILLHGWAASMFIMVGLAAALDGGLTSPLTALLFLPLTVAAMGFEPRSVWLHGTTAFATILTVGALTDTLGGGRGLLWSTSSLTVAVVGTSMARRQRGLARELAEANEELNRLARTDPLTGCLNHRSFHDELEALVAREGDVRPLVVLLLDIDDFKAVNDAYGHPIGDQVLVAAADSLRANVRPTDLVARTGGEEFAVLLPDTTLAEAASVAERLRAAISVADCGVTVTASAGLAAVPDHATTGPEVVRVADRALYQAKHAGRDRLVVAAG